MLFATSLRAKSLPKFHIFRLALPILIGAAFACSPALAEQPPSGLDEIAKASLEDLLHMTVTSVSRVPEELQDAPTPIYVLTSEDIRRSGATNLPEALRLVPGVEVAQQDANKWQVSIRGFNSRSANKLLVMIDGRTIYDPLFSGTLWETRDLMLENIDRIEVIRGPGGSTWGANAVNGVINVISKNARDTQGTVVTAGGGNEYRAFGGISYGGKILDDTYYRIFGQYAARDNGFLDQGSSDDSHNGRIGFRSDSSLDEASNVTLQGTLYDGDHDATQALGDTHGKGGSFQAQWQETLSDISKLTVQTYYERTLLDATILGERRNTAEINAQHQYQASDRLELISSLQYRYTEDHISNSDILALDPQDAHDSLISLGFQTRYDLIKDTLNLRTGAKLEHNDYSHFEVQPDIGISWNVDSNNTLWSSVSRAVRTPSRLENDGFVKGPDGGIIATGSPNLDSEDVLAYQIGYRSMPIENLLLDVATFYNVYDNLIVAEGSSIDNGAHGDTWGAELAATAKILEWWQVRASYTYLQMDLELDAGSTASPTQISAFEGSSPNNQASLWSHINVGKNWEFDVGVRYVDNLSFPQVSSYVVANTRLAYRVNKNLELAVVGQNLFDPHHFESGGPSASEVEQSVYGKVTVTF